MVWIELIVCVAIIFFMGRRVAEYGDIIAVKTKLGGVWIGLVLISVTTSLPELFTGVSAITIVNAPDLTVGNLLGANTFNLLNLALLDMYCRNSSILSTAGPGQRLSAWFSIILVLTVALSIFLQPLWPVQIGWLGWGTLIIIILYLLFVRKIFIFEKHHPPKEISETKYETKSLKRTYLYFAISAVFIIGAGVWLATIGERIAEITGLGQSFIGSLLIGFATTLPEVTVSFSALRLGAVDMAISNMLGSNMFNMFLICVDDMIFIRGPILGAISPNNLLTAAIVIVMGVIVLSGLYFKPKRYFRWSWYNILTIAVFIIGAYINFVINT